MTEENFQKSAYIKICTTDQMDMVIRDLEKLSEDGYKYVFIDEVTLMKDFRHLMDEKKLILTTPR